MRETNNVTADDVSVVDFHSKGFEEKVKDYFSKAPIKFKSRKGNKMEEIMQKVIKKYKITIPVIYIRG